MRKFLALALLLAAQLPAAHGTPQEIAPVIHHEIEASLDPQTGEIRVQDRLTLPEGGDSWDLVLHRDLDPRVVAGEADLRRVARDGHLELLRLTRHTPGPITLAYGGRIRHGLTSTTEGMGRERQSTRGTIGPEGVFLDGGSGWYPRVEGSLQTFDLRVELPEGWHAISQGAGPDREGHAGSAWSESQPQDDIYLIAAPFTLYREHGPGAEAQVWLRRPDPELATRYLTATREYLELYSGLIGPYP
ncbi:MAG: M1 family peptidase, partial [Bdellovibrio bacteriovorus]